MRLILTVLVVLLVGCSPAPPRLERHIHEDQVRVFTDRVLAEERNSPDASVRAVATTGGAKYRAAIEQTGRDVCSHMISGVPVDQAYYAAYPESRDSGGRYVAASLRTTEIASEALCPLRPVNHDGPGNSESGQ